MSEELEGPARPPFPEPPENLQCFLCGSSWGREPGSAGSERKVFFPLLGKISPEVFYGATLPSRCKGFAASFLSVPGDLIIYYFWVTFIPVPASPSQRSGLTGCQHVQVLGHSSAAAPRSILWTVG